MMEREQPLATSAGLLLLMVSGLPSEFLRQAAQAAEERERSERRLKFLQERDTRVAEVELEMAEIEAAKLIAVTESRARSS